MMQPAQIVEGRRVRVATRHRNLEFTVAANAAQTVGSGREARVVYIVEGPNGMKTSVDASELEDLEGDS